MYIFFFSQRGGVTKVLDPFLHLNMNLSNHKFLVENISKMSEVEAFSRLTIM